MQAAVTTYSYDANGNQIKCGKSVGVSPDWQNISVEEIIQLTNDMFDAASVPKSARNEYFELLMTFIMGG